MAKTTVRSEQITDATITDVDVAPANKDGADATPSMRTLGTGAGQAAKGSTTAPLASPALTGVPTAPTASPGTNTTQLATTAFVTAAASGSSNATTLGGIPASGFAILAGQTGGQLLQGGTGSSDGLALSPNTTAQAAGTQVSIQSNGSLAIVIGGTTKVSLGNSNSFGGQIVYSPSTGAPIISNSTVVCTGLNADLLDGQHASAFAPTANPTFTGFVTAPYFASSAATGTQPLTTNSTTVCTNLNADMVDGLHASSFALAGSVSGLAPLASPVFTGDPTAPTPAAGDADNSVATTAFIAAGFVSKIGGQTGNAHQVMVASNGTTAYGLKIHPNYTDQSNNTYYVFNGSGATNQGLEWYVAGILKARLGPDMMAATSAAVGVDQSGGATGSSGQIILWNGLSESTGALANRVKFTAFDFGGVDGDCRLRITSETGVGVIIGNGDVRGAGTFVANSFQSVVVAGTPPLVVASPTLVTNLNADYVDGLHSTSLVIRTGVAGGQNVYGGSNQYDRLTLRGSVNYSQVEANCGLTLSRNGSNSLTAGSTANNLVVDSTTVACLIDIPGTGVATITGLETAIGTSQAQGRTHFLFNTETADTIVLKHEDAGSTAANRFFLPSGVDYTIQPNSGVLIWYDSSFARWRLVTTQIPAAAPAAALPYKYRAGLYWYRNPTDPVNDIDVTPGNCRSEDNSADINILAQITKRLDAGWVVGNNQGGLDTGLRAANTWYYVWAILNPTNGSTDILLSASNTSPVMPSGYTKRRLIGAIRTRASDLGLYYIHDIGGALFINYLDTPGNGIDVALATLSTARQTFQMAWVPPIPQYGLGCRFSSILSGQHASVAIIIFVCSPDHVDVAPDHFANPLAQIRCPNSTGETKVTAELSSNYLGQISARSNTSASTFRLCVTGYWWPNL